MATISVVATVEANNVPPRVRLDITDSGSPEINAVTVTRTDSAGNVATVRTTDAEPLPLLTSGSTRAAVIWDYEMPYGVPVTYSTAEQPAASVTVMVDESRVWLIHPGIPDRSMPVEFRIGSFEQEERTVSAGVFYPLGRRNAIVVSDGQRKAARGSFTLTTATPGELAAVLSLIDDAGVLFLNVPALYGIGVEPQYVAIQDVSVRRLSDVGTDPHRDIVMPYVVADAPVGGSQSQWTWGDVIDQYATWADLMAAQPTWAHVLAPTS